MTAYRFKVNGEVEGKGRPRFRRSCGNVITYTPKKTKDYEAKILSSFKQKYPDSKLIDGAVGLIITAKFKRPQRLKAKKYDVLIAEGSIKPTVKPDFDNIAKVVADALNGAAYADDKQVTEHILIKRYALTDDAVGLDVCVYSADHTRHAE